MTRRIGCALLLLLFVVPLASAKRHSVVPGRGNCLYGVLDPDVFVSEIALDATHVYYVDDLDSILYRIPKNGGPRTKLAEFPNVLITEMIVDDTNVYLATLPGDFSETLPPGDIYAVPKGGGTPRTIVNGVLFATKLAADATHVYWVSVGTVKLLQEEVLSDGKVERVTKDGATRQALATGLSLPTSLGLDDTSVYFGETGQAVRNTSMGLRRVAKNGGAVTHLQDSYAVSYIEPSGNDFIFSGASADTSGLFRITKTGAVQLLVADEQIDGPPHVFDGFVYYVTFTDEEQDALMRIPVTGGTPAFLRSPDSNQSGLEIDECGIYLGNNEGELVKGTR